MAKRIDTDDLPEVQKELIESAPAASTAGQQGTRRVEPIITYDEADREKVISNDDSYIVLGGDRISSKSDGYAMQGETRAHMIDLVVGRDPTLSGNPSFEGDAARIYISQKTDIDRSLGLVAGNVMSPKRFSGVAIKADGVRIVARQGIKLVTMGKGTKSSHGEKSGTFTGIDLIANNDDTDMEPIAKAYKTADALKKIIKAVESTSTLLGNFMDAQMSFNRVLMTHGHPPSMVPAPALAVAGIFTEIRQQTLSKFPMKTHRLTMMTIGLNYLEPMTDGWIGSRYNFTN